MTDPKSEPSEAERQLRARFEYIIGESPYEKSIGRWPDDAYHAWPGNYKDINVDLAWQVLRDMSALTPAPAQPEPPTYVSQMCQPNGVLFDAFGEPRTRYVRVTLDGRHCVMHPSEGDTYLKDAKDAGDEGEYVVADVYLSEREFEDMGEFDGF